ncbi:hypothetical protein RyT2_17260 [Pseudolactococcus yaeyamensis]
MQIKVYKDVSKRDKLYSNMTISQWLFIVTAVLVFALGIVNIIFIHLPTPVIMIPSFLIVGFMFAFSMWRPYGLPFKHYMKLWFKFGTTVQKRTYKQGRIKKYTKNDFKK